MFDGLTDGRMDRQPTPEEGAIILKNAAKLIRFNYTRLRMASNADGRGVDVFSDAAKNFCAVGAIRHAAWRNGFTKSRAIEFSFKFDGLMSKNDRLSVPFLRGLTMASIIEKQTVPA